MKAMVVDAQSLPTVLAQNQPVLVDFWSAWCATCMALVPAVNALAEEYAGRAQVVTLNVQDHPSVPAQYGIRIVPAMLIFQGGQEIARLIGFKTKADLRRALDAALA